VTEQRRLEALADFEGIAQREHALKKALEEEKEKKNALKRKLKEPNDEQNYNEHQILQRKFLKIKDFLHMSRVSLCVLLAS